MRDPIDVLFADACTTVAPGGFEHGLQCARGDCSALLLRVAGCQHPPAGADDGGRNHRRFTQHPLGNVVQRRLIEGKYSVICRYRKLPRQQLRALL